MPYFVTCGDTGAEALDLEKGNALELLGAITRAYELIGDGKSNVTIHDDKGHSISGEPLLACWRGDKAITADLKAL